MDIEQFDRLLSVLTRIAGALERPPGTRVPLEQALLAIHPRPEPPYADPISPGLQVPAEWVSELGPNVRPVAADLYPPFSRSVNAPPSSSLPTTSQVPPNCRVQPEPRKEDNRPAEDSAMRVTGSVAQIRAASPLDRIIDEAGPRARAAFNAESARLASAREAASRSGRPVGVLEEWAAGTQPDSKPGEPR